MTALARIRSAPFVYPKTTALIAGAVSATGFAPLSWSVLTLLAMALLIVLIGQAPRGRRAFALGWWFGLGQFAVSLNWIATAFTYQAAMPAWLGWVAVLLLSLYLSIYPGMAAAGAWWVSHLGTRSDPNRLRHFRAGGKSTDATSVQRHPEMDSRLRGNDEAGEKQNLLPLILAFAAMWVITEWLRSWVFTGFAWNPLSAVMLKAFDGPLLIRWVGTYGSSGLTICIVGLFIWTWRYLHRARPGKAAPSSGRMFLAWLFLPAAWMSPLFFLDKFSETNGRDISLRRTASSITIVQPNVGQQDKWEGGRADANFAKLARLTTAPASSPPRLILWPEAAIPDYLEPGYPPIYYDRSPVEARMRLTALMNSNDLMLLGALKLETDAVGDVVGARNSVMSVRADGTLGPRYDKAHLVPFGEYLPLRGALSRIGLSRLAPGDLDFWPGPGPRTVNLGAFGKAGMQVCYEIIFSGQVADRADRPDFLFNPSNDAWFGAWGPPQHLAQARLRAIEEGLPVIRATPTGISAVIAADGTVMESIPHGTAGRTDTRLPAPHQPTLFARYGNILPLLFAALLLICAVAFGRRRR